MIGLYISRNSTGVEYNTIGKTLTNGQKSEKFVIISNHLETIDTLPVVLQELPLTFVNPSLRIQESPRSFSIKRFKSLKWSPKIEEATEELNQERFLSSSRPIQAGQKRSHKIWCDSPS